MKKRKKKKNHQPPGDKTNQHALGGEKQSETPKHRIVENILKHVRSDHRIPSAAILGSGQLNFDVPRLIESAKLNSAEEIID